MHTMQETRTPFQEAETRNGYSELLEGSRPKKEGGPEVRDTVAAVIGMLLPLLTQLGHHHH
jgi:zinc transporter 9